MKSQSVNIKLPAPHESQRQILSERRRFTVAKCGRRFGKTELCQILFAEMIAMGERRIAYFSPTYKDLYEVWNEVKSKFSAIIQKKDESVKQLIFYGGARLDCWSMEDPDSGRGRKYHRVIIDECEKAKKFREAWEGAIRGTLVDYRGDCYFLSTPQFGDTFFKQIARYETGRDDWKTFRFTSYDNPYVPRDEIDAARDLLDPAVFRCEYLAEDIDGRALNPFAHQFDESIHVGDAPFQPFRPLLISIDFNLNPFAVTFHHIWRDATGVHHHVVDELAINNGSIPEMVDKINQKYRQYLPMCQLTGDAMGKRGDISQRDNASYYTQLVDGLHLSFRQLNVRANPRQSNSRSDVNYVLNQCAKLPNYEFLINPECTGTIYDMKYVQCDAFGNIEKRNRRDVAQRADYLDTIRYAINTGWRKYLNFPRR